MQISIAMCTYNGSKYIKEQLDSIMAQDTLPDEIVIHDDCSTDNTMAICHQYATAHSELKWTVVRNESNIGWRRNFFETISACSGDYIFLSDQDDIWLPNHISSMFDILNRMEGANLVVSKARPFYEEGSMRSGIDCGPYLNDQAIEVIPFTVNYLGMKAPGCTYGFKKQFFNSIETYWNPNFAHDGFIYAFSNLTESAVALNEVTVEFRRHASNSSDLRKKNRKSLNTELDYMIGLHEELIRYSEGLESTAIKERRNQLEFARDWLYRRKNAVNTNNIFKAILLLRYIASYPSIRSYFGDMWCTIFKTKSFSR